MTESNHDASKRSLLRFLGYSVAAVPVLAMTPEIAWSGPKTSKSAAKYQDHPHDGQHCSKCTYFQPPHSCKLVKGTIDPNGWCTLFTAKSG